MTFAELKRMTLSGNYGDIVIEGNDIVMPIFNGLGDRIGIVTFDLPDDVDFLEELDVDELIVKSFDF